MKRIEKRILIIATMLCMLFAAVPVSAARQIQNDYVRITRPDHNSTIYKGEPISYTFKMKNPWKKCLCQPEADLIASNGEIVRGSKGGYIEIGKSGKCTGTFTTENLNPGVYYFKATTIPIDSKTKTVADKGRKKRYAQNSIIIKELKPVKSVTAHASVDKVVVSFKKATGATSYKIFRSLSKDKGYNQIGTTESTSYIDLDVNKGERYYYRIVSVRNKKATVLSAFSNAGYCRPVR